MVKLSSRNRLTLYEESGKQKGWLSYEKEIDFCDGGLPAARGDGGAVREDARGRRA